MTAFGEVLQEGSYQESVKEGKAKTFAATIHSKKVSLLSLASSSPSMAVRARQRQLPLFFLLPSFYLPPSTPLPPLFRPSILSFYLFYFGHKCNFQIHIFLNSPCEDSNGVGNLLRAHFYFYCFFLFLCFIVSFFFFFSSFLFSYFLTFLPLPLSQIFFTSSKI